MKRVIDEDGWKLYDLLSLLVGASAAHGVLNKDAFNRAQKMLQAAFPAAEPASDEMPAEVRDAAYEAEGSGKNLGQEGSEATPPLGLAGQAPALPPGG